MAPGCFTLAWLVSKTYTEVLITKKSEAAEPSDTKFSTARS